MNNPHWLPRLIAVLFTLSVLFLLASIQRPDRSLYWPLAAGSAIAALCLVLVRRLTHHA